MKKIWFAALIFSGLAGNVSADPLEKIAKKLSEGAKKLKSHHVAVLPFPYHDGRNSRGSTIISERLTTLLVERKKLDVIERSLLENVLKELKLQASGAVDGESAKRIGKLLGVEAIINGTLIDLKANEVEVNARLILVESGQILAAASASVENIWGDDAPPLLLTNRTSSPEGTEDQRRPSLPQAMDEGYGLESLPLDAFIIESDFTPETVRTPFGEEFLQGIKLIRNGNAGAAESHFESMHEKLKGNPKMDALVKLGWSMSLFEQGSREKAVKAAQDVARQDHFPRIRAMAHYILGKYSEAVGDNRTAEGHYLNVVRDSPYATILVRSAGRRLKALTYNPKSERRKLAEIRRELRNSRRARFR